MLPLCTTAGLRSPGNPARLVRAVLCLVLGLSPLLTPGGSASALAQGPGGQAFGPGQPLAEAPPPAAEEPVSGESAAAAPAAQLIPIGNFFDIMREGGLLMWPIFGFSLVMVAFIFERLISLRRSRVIPAAFVRRFLHQLEEGVLDKDEAIALCEENPSPVAEVFGAAARKWGRPAVEVEQAILDAGERVVNQLRKYIRVFNAVSTVTPLLGLLGTVVGMIEAFNAIASTRAMGKPELLASGIAQALLTTAAGLTVAIPALICYLYFIGRVDQLVVEIDALGQELVGTISAEALAEAPRSKPSGSRVRRSQQDSAA